MKTELKIEMKVLVTGLLSVSVLLFTGCDWLKNRGTQTEVGAQSAGAAAATEKSKVPVYSGIEIPNLIPQDIGQGMGAEVGPESTVNIFMQAWVYDPAAPNNRGSIVFETRGESEKFDMKTATGLRGTIGTGLHGMKAGGKRRLIIPADLAKDSTVPDGAILMVEATILDPAGNQKKTK